MKSVSWRAGGGEGIGGDCEREDSVDSSSPIWLAGPKEATKTEKPRCDQHSK